jgi:ESX secretion system protein EccE
VNGSAFPASRMGLYLSEPAAFGNLDLLAGAGGLVVGHNRQKEPVVLRLFRPEPVRLMLVGGVRCAQLLASRAVALGAQLFIQTGREQVWDAFLRSAVIGRDIVSFLPVGAQPPQPASSSAPQLMVVDTGPATGPDPVAGTPWRATLVVRDDLASWDVDALVRSDVVLLQRLTEPEAALAVSSLGLAEAQNWLPRIHPEMVGLVSKGRLQWVLLSMTNSERSLLGTVARTG